MFCFFAEYYADFLRQVLFNLIGRLQATFQVNLLDEKCAGPSRKTDLILDINGRHPHQIILKSLELFGSKMYLHFQDANAI